MYVHYTKMIFNQDFYVHSCLLFELKFLCHQKLIFAMPATMLHHKDGLESKMLSTNYYEV